MIIQIMMILLIMMTLQSLTAQMIVCIINMIH